MLIEPSTYTIDELRESALANCKIDPRDFSQDAQRGSGEFFIDTAISGSGLEIEYEDIPAFESDGERYVTLSSLE